MSHNITNQLVWIVEFAQAICSPWSPKPEGSRKGKKPRRMQMLRTVGCLMGSDTPVMGGVDLLSGVLLSKNTIIITLGMLLAAHEQLMKLGLDNKTHRQEAEPLALLAAKRLDELHDDIRTQADFVVVRSLANPLSELMERLVLIAHALGSTRWVTSFRETGRFQSCYPLLVPAIKCLLGEPEPFG